MNYLTIHFIDFQFSLVIFQFIFQLSKLNIIFYHMSYQVTELDTISLRGVLSINNLSYNSYRIWQKGV